MSNISKNNRIKSLIEKSNFMKKILVANSIQEVKDLFLSHKVEINDEDVRNLYNNIVQAEAKSKMMSDDELDNIAGGEATTGEKIKYGATGALVGTAVMLPAVGYCAYKGFKQGVDYTKSWWKKLRPGEEIPDPTITTYLVSREFTKDNSNETKK